MRVDVLFLLLTSLMGHAQNQCPTSSEDLQTSLATYSESISQQLFSSSSKASYEPFANWINSCSEQIKLTDPKNCSANFKKYILQKNEMHSSQHSFGFKISNAAYIKKTPKNALSLPEEFVHGLPKTWRETAEKKGWKYIEFFSSSVPFWNPESHDTNEAGEKSYSQVYRRLVFYIPEHDGYQKWLQFVPPQLQKNNIENVYHIDLIAVDKDSQDQNQQHHMQYVRDNISEPFVPKATENLSRCISCHANGPRIIRPWPGYITEGNITPDKMANFMYKAQNSNWGKEAVDIAAMGPALGSKQTCTNCHDPSEYGTGNDEAGLLHDSFSIYQIKHKMVEALQMPPTFLHDSKFRDLSNVLDKLNSLSDLEKQKIKSLDYQSYEELIPKMLLAKFISQDLADLSLSQLKTARQEQEENFEQLKKDQRVILKKWLQGDDLTDCKNK